MANDPGWYSDPWRPGRRRWWDGTQWTDHTFEPEHELDAPRDPQAAAPPPSRPPAPPAAAAVDPKALARTDIAAERRLAGRAHVGFTLIAGAQAVGLLASAFMSSDLRDTFDSGDLPATTTGWQVSSNLAAVVVLVGLVLVAIWTHRVATIGRNLGYPARRSPGWAVAGWFVPVVNLWFPYQALCDAFTSGNPDRRLVGRWWGLYIASVVGALVVFAAGFVSTGAALAVALPAILASVLSARYSWDVIDALLADHEAAIAAITGDVA
jgi:hypothetical protein